MSKKVTAMVKLQIPAGKATPAPPVGTALGPHGLNIMDFCKNFNAKTAKDDGLIIPVVVTVGRAEPQQGRHGHRQAGRGHRQAEDARSQLPGSRRGDPDRPRDGAFDGH
jgi:hypothetical protein